MRTLLVVTAAIIASSAAPAAALASTVELAAGVRIEERASNPAQKYGLDGANVFLPAGAILGVRDIQGGSWVPGIPSMLNLDIGAGNAQSPGVLNLGADVTRMVRMQNGQHETVLATRNDGLVIKGRLRVCAPRCVDVGRRLGALERRVERLERALAR